MKRVETGTIRDHSYARAGTGSKPLVVVPGIDDAMFSGRYPKSVAWMLYWYFSSFRDDRAVYVVSRPRGLESDCDIGDMADGYASVAAELGGSADVLGLSMGGMIGLDLASGYPDAVDRLVIANSGRRIDDLDAVDRFREYARDHDWGRIRAELGAAMFTDWRRFVYPQFAVTAGRFVTPKPADPSDVLVSLDAAGAFDATDRLDEVAAPTLVFGGTDDPYFPEHVLESTADGIPDAELSSVRGGKHGAYHERKARFDADVSSFLSTAADRDAAAEASGD